MAISISGTTLTFNDNTTQTTAATGTVSSVATGNGLSGGTITSTGTLTIACPSFNTVGSYVSARLMSGPMTGGSNYAAGGNAGQMTSGALMIACGLNEQYSVNLSGTWKWMGASVNNGSPMFGLACRVS